ncbi:MAG: tyrosine-type recombinase/integrase, partial [Limnobacter sp.]|nr:tyrosine-type recombinase/integrase [Limnobacter sp.]
TEKRRSPHTLSATARDLAILGQSPEQLTHDNLRALLVSRRSKGAAPTSLARLASSWRGYYQYLVDTGCISSSPAQALKTPKKPARLPKVVSMDSLQAVLLKPFDPEQIEFCRAQVLVELLYFTGLRISEATSLVWADQLAGNSSSTHWLCLDRKELQVLGKGGKSRIVPLVGVLVSRLRDWRELWSSKAGQLGLQPSSRLFNTLSGKVYSVRMAQADVERFGLVMNLGQHLHPHMLRHSFGSHVLQESQNLRGVQELLGHASIASTQVYTSLDFKHLASVYDQAFPRSKKN